MTNPRYSPDARLTTGVTPLPAAMRASISSISVQSGLDGVDRLEVRLANENLRWLEHPLLSLGRELRLSLGYAPDPLEQVFVGDIVGQTPTFPADGIPTLTIVAHDRRERLQRGTKKRWFAVAIPCVGTFPIPDPIVVGSVAAESHLLLATDPISLAISAAIGGLTYATQMTSNEGRQEAVRKQESETDFDFIQRIAAENGWAMSIDHTGALGGSVLRFTSLLSNRPPDLTLRYGESLVEFSPRITKVGEILSISARFWIPQAKLELTATVGWDWDRQSLDVRVEPSESLPVGSGSGADAGGEGKSRDRQQPSLTLVGESVSAATVARVILSKLLPKLNQRLTGTGTTIGDTRLRVGAIMAIDGVGRQFGGSYRLTGVTHTLDASGFRTSFEVRKEFWLNAADMAAALDPRAVLASANPLRQLTGVSG